MAFLRLAGDAFDLAKPVVLVALLRVILVVSMWIASPFFAFAILGYLLDWPTLAVIILAGLGGLVVLGGIGLWIAAWLLLRRARETLRRAERVEALAFDDLAS